MPRTEDQRPIIVRSFPASDSEFAEATGSALQDARAERIERTDAPEVAAPTLRDIVERRIRAAYKNARIHVQDELADLGMHEIVWYAYRDGRIRDADPSRERLYAAVASARRTIRESEAAIDHARRAASGAGFDDDTVLAHGADARGRDATTPQATNPDANPPDGT